MKKVSLVVLLACASVCWGQQVTMKLAVNPSYGQFTHVDHTANCIYPNGHSCWSADAGGSSFIQVITTDQTAIATDSSGCAWVYSDSVRKGTNTWTKQPQWGCGLSYVQYASNGSLYALVGSCSSGHNLSKFNGTSWVSLGSRCYTVLSVDPGTSTTFAMIDTSKHIWQSANAGVNTTESPSCSQGALSVAVLNPNLLGVICTDNTTYYVPPSGTNPVQLPTSAKFITGNSSTVFVLGTDSNVYRWKLGVSTAFDHFVPAGTHSSFLTYDYRLGNIWTVDSGATYRLFEWGLSATRTAQFSTICTGGPCPGPNQGVFHHYITQAMWKVHGKQSTLGNYVTSGPVPPSTPTIVQSTAVLDDIGGCFADPNNCFIGVIDEEGDCNEEGQLYNDSGSNNGLSIQYEYAYTKMEATGAPDCGLSTDLQYICVYDVTTGCDNTTTPNFHPVLVDFDDPNALSFDTYGSCFDINHTGWFCPLSYQVWADAASHNFTQSNACTNTAP